MLYTKIPKTGDPSPDLQHFANLQLRILCCHYWAIEVWKHSNLSFPYWRLYWNNIPGGKIEYNYKEYELTPDKIMLVPPYTSFSTYYDPMDKSTQDTDYFIGQPLNLYEDLSNNTLRHLFIHFSLGVPFDKIEPQILTFPVTGKIDEMLSELKNSLFEEKTEFSNNLSMQIYVLITTLLSKINTDKWESQSYKYKISKILRFIDNNLDGNLSNKKLSSLVNMSPNSFLRLFTNELRISPKQYILKKKVEKACVILNYSEYSIDEIAQQLGFNDRFYFTRVFKKYTKVSPAAYRKKIKF